MTTDDITQNSSADAMLDEMRFCPICGQEGHDLICPICNEKTESLSAEVERISKIEEETDLTEDAGLDEESLEMIAQSESLEADKAEVEE